MQVSLEAKAHPQVVLKATTEARHPITALQRQQLSKARTTAKMRWWDHQYLYQRKQQMMELAQMKRMRILRRTLRPTVRFL